MYLYQISPKVIPYYSLKEPEATNVEKNEEKRLPTPSAIRSCVIVMIDGRVRIRVSICIYHMQDYARYSSEMIIN